MRSGVPCAAPWSAHQHLHRAQIARELELADRAGARTRDDRDQAIRVQRFAAPPSITDQRRRAIARRDTVEGMALSDIHKVGLGVLAAVIVFGALGAAGVFDQDEPERVRYKSPPSGSYVNGEPIVKKLRWDKESLDPQEFYASMRRNGIDVERDGNELTIKSPNCADVEQDFEKTIPNGLQVRCRSGTKTVWLLDRR
jgi:hypothetical protein